MERLPAAAKTRTRRSKSAEPYNSSPREPLIRSIIRKKVRWKPALIKERFARAFSLYQSLREKASEKRDFRENSRNFSTGFPMVRCVKGASIFPKRKKGEEKTGECWFLRRFSLFLRWLFTVSTEFSTWDDLDCFCLKDTKFWDFWMCGCALKRTMLYWCEENVYNYTRFERRRLCFSFNLLQSGSGFIFSGWKKRKIPFSPLDKFRTGFYNKNQSIW